LFLRDRTFKFEFVSKLNDLNKKKLIILRNKQLIVKNEQKSDKELLFIKVNVNKNLLNDINKLKLRLMFNIAS